MPVPVPERERERERVRVRVRVLGLERVQEQEQVLGPEQEPVRELACHLHRRRRHSLPPGSRRRWKER